MDVGSLDTAPLKELRVKFAVARFEKVLAFRAVEVVYQNTASALSVWANYAGRLTVRAAYGAFRQRLGIEQLFKKQRYKSSAIRVVVLH